MLGVFVVNIFKAAFTDFFWPSGRVEQDVNTTSDKMSSYEVVTNMLANSFLISRPADTKYSDLTGVVFVSIY